MMFEAKDCYNSSGGSSYKNDPLIYLPILPISPTKNKFIAVGCYTYAVFRGRYRSQYATGCLSVCESMLDVINGSCSGIGCCETSIPRDANQYSISVTSYRNHVGIWEFNPCGYAFVAEDGFFNFSTGDLSNPPFGAVPIVVDWSIPNKKCDDAKKNTTTYMCQENSNCTDAENGNGYQCNCLEGFQGNPYLQNGCQGSIESARIFTDEELKKAMDHYHESQILGQGGQGTVYLGILPNNMVVAIKKAKILDRSQVEEFINELIILSQINHRNVVKLIGCCFETEVPLLVYEFVTNGTLSDHMHKCALVLALRCIRSDFAQGHKEHKHIVGRNYTAKVANFGASRLVPLDRTQLTTLVQGTLGYLDPEYLQSGQLTEKSDVYSFGVVLAELLTGLRSLSFERAESERNLSLYFASAIKGERLFEIIDPRVLNEGNPEEIKEVAMLASRCLRVKGEDQPTMKEVAMELEGLMKVIDRHPWVNQSCDLEEAEQLLGERSSKCDGILKSNAPGNDDSISNQVPFEIESGR
ncbi:hypothetical protein BT93_L3814 [Corymbia citriodora subsp. variegata]|uniref:Uncharacterized protein n=1 Tax=Corymbia citriodora subsp. variegata TaxID=360336 RepID=A0A8T0CIV4_CORYI|nr:hypothetical protein BT93_L3814 [Corymbia citriodora subsp. variegata]